MNEKLIENSVAEHNAAISSIADQVGEIRQAGESLVATVANGGRIFVCGNGGSASDAQHFAAELTGRFVAERRGYPAIALTTDTSALTAIGNDYGFDRIFSRQLEAVAKAGDYLLAISTSGNSSNVIAAVQEAREMGVATLGLLGRDGGALAELVDQALIVPAQSTARIQEGHIFILHLLCQAFEPC